MDHSLEEEFANELKGCKVLRDDSVSCGQAAGEGAGCADVKTRVAANEAKVRG